MSFDEPRSNAISHTEYLPSPRTVRRQCSSAWPRNSGPLGCSRPSSRDPSHDRRHATPSLFTRVHRAAIVPSIGSGDSDGRSRSQCRRTAKMACASHSANPAASPSSGCWQVADHEAESDIISACPHRNLRHPRIAAPAEGRAPTAECSVPIPGVMICFTIDNSNQVTRFVLLRVERAPSN